MKLTLIRNCFIFSLLSLSVFAQTTTAETEKVVITEADQLPRIDYPFEGKVTELFADEEALKEYLEKAEAEIASQLEKFDIQDKATMRGYYNNLRTMDILNGEYGAALEKIEKIRDLTDKPSDKLTSGLIAESLLEVYIKEGRLKGESLAKAFRERYESKVNALEWAIVQDSIESTNGLFQYISENLYMGSLDSQMQVTVDQNKALTLGDVASLAGLRFMIDQVLPLKDVIVEVTGDYIKANRVEKADIWEARTVDLTGVENLTPVVVAVWDSGVDADIFTKTGQMWINSNETLDGKDSDGNGFVDDVYGPAWDLESHRTTGSLYPLTEEQLAAYPEELSFTKGLMDLQAAVESEEAAETRKRMSNLAREDYKPFVENLSLFGNYTHGTHVGGIIAAGNPAVRLMAARITFGYELIPEEPTLAESIRAANETTAFMDYLKANHVRVVNMSWGGTQAGIEGALEANGIGDSPEHRAEIARVLFEIGYDGLYEAMKNTPEILFVPAAGNSDEDVDFNKVIPSSIDLPNVFVVGAVDQAGEETDFTSFGKNIRAHANGFEVASYVPGGRIMKFSGTSMSAPNVVNLAAKLLAIDPSLDPQGVIELIQEGIDVSEDGRRFLINPKKSISILISRLAE